MVKMTLSQFFSLQFSLSECGITEAEFDSVVVDEDEHGNEIRSYVSWVSGYVIMKAAADVEFGFGWLAQGGEASYSDALTFRIEPDGDVPSYTLKGLILVKENGSPLNESDLSYAFKAMLDEMDAWKRHVRLLLPNPGTIDDGRSISSSLACEQQQESADLLSGLRVPGRRET